MREPKKNETRPQWKMVTTWANGDVTAEWYDDRVMAIEMRKLAGLLADIYPGEKFTIERISL